MTRSTRQRDALTEVLLAAGRPLLPQEILDEARGSVAGMGLATVYRNLKRLLEDGVIQAVELPGEGVRYELALPGHHHHFQCTSCRRAFDVPGCVSGLDRLAPRGFSVDRHEVTLYGRCADCKSAARRAAR